MATFRDVHTSIMRAIDTYDTDFDRPLYLPDMLKGKYSLPGIQVPEINRRMRRRPYNTLCVNYFHIEWNRFTDKHSTRERTIYDYIPDRYPALEHALTEMEKMTAAKYQQQETR